jgi:hypothetical protein
MAVAVAVAVAIAVAVAVAVAVAYLPINKMRHLDRSDRRWYRLSRRGETPHFAFAVAFPTVIPKSLPERSRIGDLLLQ